MTPPPKSDIVPLPFHYTLINMLERGIIHWLFIWAAFYKTTYGIAVILFSLMEWSLMNKIYINLKPFIYTILIPIIIQCILQISE